MMAGDRIPAARPRLTMLLPLFLAAFLAAAPEVPAISADSVRQEAGRLAAQGRMEEALSLVDRHEADLPAVWKAMFAGKLELEGETAARGYTGAAADSAPEQMRGEAVFRLGQYHYAAGRPHLAIPQFRTYLARHPGGVWSQEAAYWMAHACLQLVRQRPDRAAYLDTAAAYLRGVEAKGRSAYYWPLARATHARVHLLRGDTAEAGRALRDARGRAPAEEVPGVLLLSLQAGPSSPEAPAWEDSLRWKYPLSPETRLLAQATARAGEPRRPAPVPTPAMEARPAARATHALQLGAFAELENARRLQRELAAKKISARVEPLRTEGRTLYRVLVGEYPGADAAARDGKLRLSPKGYKFRVVER